LVQVCKVGLVLKKHFNVKTVSPTNTTAKLSLSLSLQKCRAPLPSRSSFLQLFGAVAGHSWVAAPPPEFIQTNPFFEKIKKRLNHSSLSSLFKS